MNKLEQLRTMTEVVADTGDVDAIARLRPVDATTNPSLLLKAAGLPRFAETLAEIKAAALSPAAACDRFAVAVGREVTELVPGWVSTEVDARLSFDTNATVARARQIIALYDDLGVGAERVLIKIAATWEGIRAADILEREGIRCNLTLLFGFPQAIACADAGVTLISPFVGRILDWHLANSDRVISQPDDDPGVQSVRQIHQHYKQYGYDTIVMGASFRNVGEIQALAGCDRLTISPALLDELAEDSGELPRQLFDAPAESRREKPSKRSESEFRFALNEDAMATEKLADGIRRFAADQIQLEALLVSPIKGF